MSKTIKKRVKSALKVTLILAVGLAIVISTFLPFITVILG